MSSSYSPLKIELMVTGENTLTWGDKTNANLNAFEEMVVGTAELVFNNANLPPLTLAQTNAPQQGRCFRLHCTGDLGGAARSLTLPPSIKKTYLVHNDCQTGPSDIIVKPPGGGATITVPAGKITLVYYDGVNVTSMVTHLQNLSVATLGVTGAFTANSFSVTTGTVTGTLTAGAINTGVGGVGGNIVLGKGGQLHIPSADGSAATSIIYNATSDLRFWNAGDRMVINAGGVGIGRAPGTPLDVEGQGRFVTYATVRAGGSGEATVQFVDNGAGVEFSTISSFAPGHMRYQANAGGVHYFVTSGAERMRIGSDGNVGIGISGPAHKLHVAGNVVLTDTINFGFYGSGAGLTGYAASLTVAAATNATTSASCSGNAATATTASNANALGGLVPAGYMTRYCGVWQTSYEDGIGRFHWATNSHSYFKTGDSFVWHNRNDTQIAFLDSGGNFTAQGNVAAYSDRKLKTNLEPITNGLEKVLLLNGYTYDRIDDPEGRRRVGLIAQEVQQVLPEAVIDQGGTLALDYGNMVALLVEAIKDLREEVQYLKGYGK